MHRVILYSFLASTLLYAGNSHAQSASDTSRRATGFLGLNTTPNARMNPVGDVEIGTEISDPYMHGFIGIQIAKPLLITLRQSAEISNVTEDADRLYPGVDFKLRLAPESEYSPEIALGMRSALGHKRMSGEYLAFSKRYNNFDFTGGLGWGRFGSAGHFTNPLKIFSDHFDKDRIYNSETANSAENWFTGDKVGLFAGVEYFLPYDGLSLKLDYGADRYSAEKESLNFKAPAPWSIGLTYQSPYNINTSLAMLGTDKIMARLSIHGNVKNWPKPSTKSAADIDYTVTPAGYQSQEEEEDHESLYARIEVPEHQTTTQAFAHSLRYMAQYAGPNVTKLYITASANNIISPTLEIPRSNVDKLLDNNKPFPEELWKNTSFTVAEIEYKDKDSLLPYLWKNLNHKITLQNDIAIDGEETPLYYRSALISELTTHDPFGFFHGAGLRVNIDDNLSDLNVLRETSPYPVKSDIDKMTRKRVTLENFYSGYGYSASPSWHSMFTAGFLDEFYMGYGAEILYRPYDSRLAFGAEFWQLGRRTPSTLNTQMQGTLTESAFLNAWYDVPRYDATIHAKIGQYLAGDLGGALAIEKDFPSGASMRAEFALSNYNETDLFGDSTHAYHRLSLNLPLGGFAYMPQNSFMRTNIGPLGRDIAQSLEKPVSLYETTNKLSLKHIHDHWGDLTQ